MEKALDALIAERVQMAAQAREAHIAIERAADGLAAKIEGLDALIQRVERMADERGADG